MQRDTGTGASVRPAEPARFWRRLLKRMREDRRVELLVYGGIAVLVGGAVLCRHAHRWRRAGAGGRAGDRRRVGSGAGDHGCRRCSAASAGPARVEVMITYDTSREIVPAMTTNVNSTGSESSNGDGSSSSSQQSTESTEPATVSGSGGNEPIVLKEIEPQVRGRHRGGGRRGGYQRADGPAARRPGRIDIRIVFERSAQSTN